MNFAGNTQTCFSDWGRTLLEFFIDPKFNIDGEMVHVYMNNVEVAHYDFGSGSGFIEAGHQSQPASAIGRFESFTPIPIDTFLQN